MTSLRITKDNALEFWYQALEEEFGLCIPLLNYAEDRKTVEKLLYDARNASGDKALDTLKLVHPKDKGEIWIMKRTGELEDAAEK